MIKKNWTADRSPVEYVMLFRRQRLPMRRMKRVLRWKPRRPRARMQLRLPILPKTVGND